MSNYSNIEGFKNQVSNSIAMLVGEILHAHRLGSPPKICFRSVSASAASKSHTLCGNGGLRQSRPTSALAERIGVATPTHACCPASDPHRRAFAIHGTKCPCCLGWCLRHEAAVQHRASGCARLLVPSAVSKSDDGSWIQSTANSDYLIPPHLWIQHSCPPCSHVASSQNSSQSWLTTSATEWQKIRLD